MGEEREMSEVIVKKRCVFCALIFLNLYKIYIIYIYRLTRFIAKPMHFFIFITKLIPFQINLLLLLLFIINF